MAVSAVDVALWDLKARLLDLPLHRLLGGGACRDGVPVYGSGGFTTYSGERLRGQLAGWLRDGMSRVKIKIGESSGSRVDRDLRRVAEARATIGPDAELYVDANGAYDAKQAIRVAEALDEHGVSWFEEPVSSDDPRGLRRVRDAVRADVAAGEYAADLASFVPLLDAVDCLQIDATRCGGYTEWLRVAALAAAHGLEVSGHCAPRLHAPVALVTPNLRHVEWFHDHARIAGLAFDPEPRFAGGELTLDETPGHGIRLRTADLAPYRVA
jgi:L-alanine-DL-glutamate epimerase-like enolase superfamily enzyme